MDIEEGAEDDSVKKYPTHTAENIRCMMISVFIVLIWLGSVFQVPEESSPIENQIEQFLERFDTKILERQVAKSETVIDKIPLIKYILPWVSMEYQTLTIVVILGLTILNTYVPHIFINLLKIGANSCFAVQVATQGLMFLTSKPESNVHLDAEQCDQRSLYCLRFIQSTSSLLTLWMFTICFVAKIESDIVKNTFRVLFKSPVEVALAVTITVVVIAITGLTSHVMLSTSINSINGGWVLFGSLFLVICPLTGGIMVIAPEAKLRIKEKEISDERIIRFCFNAGLILSMATIWFVLFVSPLKCNNMNRPSYIHKAVIEIIYLTILKDYVHIIFFSIVLPIGLIITSNALVAVALDIEKKLRNFKWQIENCE